MKIHANKQKVREMFGAVFAVLDEKLSIPFVKEDCDVFIANDMDAGEIEGYLESNKIWHKDELLSELKRYARRPDVVMAFAMMRAENDLAGFVLKTPIVEIREENGPSVAFSYPGIAVVIAKLLVVMRQIGIVDIPGKYEEFAEDVVERVNVYDQDIKSWEQAGKEDPSVDFEKLNKDLGALVLKGRNKK